MEETKFPDQSGSCQKAMDQTLNVITIDGPAGVGKTTLARTLAEKIQIAFLDTGAMFRAIALDLGDGADQLATDVLRIRLAHVHFRIQGTGQKTALFCNENLIGSEIRTEQVAMLASKIARIPTVREFLARAEREIASKTPLVAEGRDMGTVIFPTARCKFFLDASPEIRANRRLNDPNNHEQTDLETLIRQIKERDAQDRNREIAPLKPADDAIIIDTSNLSIAEVLARMEKEIRAKGGFKSLKK